ncbi:MAG: hypothetical protein LBI53_01840 [Candidatus Peribacteria bacterium]|nr:hypothetical protein [Candidatus Peribacteria bacterium]
MGDPLEVEKRILMVLDKQETYGGIVRAAYPEFSKDLHDKTVLSDATFQQEDLK